jgi:predicted Zn-dependent peptidase
MWKNGTTRVTLALALAFALVEATLLPAAALDRSVYGGGIFEGPLPHGGRYVVTAPSSAPLSAVELWYAVPSSGFDAEAVPSIARLAAQSVAASKPATGSSLGEYVASIGGTLSIDVFPNSTAITALVPTREAPATLHLMTESYFSPVVTEAGLRQARRDLATEGLLEQYDPEVLIHTGLFAALFQAGPAHTPSLDLHDLPRCDLASVRRFAERGFVPWRAVLVVSGMVPSELAAVVPGRQEAVERDDAALLSTPAGPPGASVIPFTEPGKGYAWRGPGIDDELASTAMDFIADYLFHPIGGLVTRRLASQLPDIRLNGQFITLRPPGVFLFSLIGRGSDSAAAIALAEITKLAATPLSGAEFARARDVFLYHLQSDLQSPADLAASLGWYAAEGRPGYAPGAQSADGGYWKILSQLSPETVRETARKFLVAAPATVTLHVTGGGKAE